MSRFKHLQGSMDKEQFQAMMKKTRYKRSTGNMLFRYLVRGIPYSETKGASRQFVYKKLCELDKKGLLTSRDS